ncbi:MAG: copper resistance protein CopC [Rhodospirillaceae bacterium]|nr:copper resistance protein CopC [Rhodospirillaceae bacterium]
MKTLVLCWLLAGLPGAALAHAIIVAPQPATGETVTGPDVDVVFTFNVRIDGARSKLILTRPDGGTVEIALLPNPSPAVLAGRLTGLTPGAYSIRWQVLATDGHITRGDVPFVVAP